MNTNNSSLGLFLSISRLDRTSRRRFIDRKTLAGIGALVAGAIVGGIFFATRKKEETKEDGDEKAEPLVSQELALDAPHRDMKAKVLRAIKIKVPACELTRVLSTVVGGKRLADHVEIALRSKGAGSRLGCSFWAPMFKAYNVKHNPVADLQFPGENSEWPTALIEALTDCHSDNACARGHGLAAFKCCLGEMDTLSNAALRGLLSSIFTMDVPSASFVNKLLSAMLSWFARGGRAQLHSELWKASAEVFDAALSDQFEMQGLTAKTFASRCLPSYLRATSIR